MRLRMFASCRFGFETFAAAVLLVTIGCSGGEDRKQVASGPAEEIAPPTVDQSVQPNAAAEATQPQPAAGPDRTIHALEPSTLEPPPSDSAQERDENTPRPDDSPPGAPLLVAPATGQAAAKKDEPKLIPRDVLFGNPEKAAARISPDGRSLSHLAPVDGVLNVWVSPVDRPGDAKPVTQEKVRPVRRYFWAYTSKHILYVQDADGDENYHVYSVNVESQETKDLTPIKNVQARIEGVSEKFPSEILVGLNDRVPELHDIHRVNIETGERTLVEKNPGLAGYLSDDDFKIRLALTFGPDGSQLLLKPDEKEGWKEWLKVPPMDALTTEPVGFDKSGEKLYLVDSRDRNTSSLTTVDLASGEQEVLAANPKADVGGVLAHPTEKTVQAVSFTYARKEWEILDPAIAKDLEYLRQLKDGEVEVTSRSLDDKHWTVAYIVDDGPVLFYHYDRDKTEAKYLFSSRSDLDNYRLANMHPVVIPARDGLELVSYLTLPPAADPDGDARPARPLPMVLDVHGGPWARDDWGYNPSHQWLANRGYAVLSVNFRGSTGFGKQFVNAADGEWSGKMHDDLLDAVNWAVTEGIGDKQKVAIMGGSYGGYATLVGLTFTPDVFACGVDIVGPSSLVTLLENVPPYWASFMPVMKERVGDHTTEEGRKRLLARSPLNFVERIQRPLLIGQGANDPRVKRAEADQIVHAMQEKNIPVTYVLYPDEGHGFARPENQMAFNAVVEAFLAAHLGGRFEPVGDDFRGATITVPAGAKFVPGLDEALSGRSKPAEEL